MASNVITLEDGSGRQMECVEAYGFNLPLGEENMLKQDGGLRGHLDKVRRMNVRADDELISSYPKTGVHWLWEMVSMMKNGNTEYNKCTKNEISLDFKTMGHLEQLPSPRLLSTHLPPHLLPSELINRRKRIIHLMRNPKDVCVSFWAMHKQIDFWDYEGSFESYVPLFLGNTGKHFMYSWFQYELDWEKFCQDNPGYPIINVYYENLQRDTVSELSRIARFMDISVDCELLRDIVRQCDFNNLKTATDFMNKDKSKIFSKTGQQFMFRKGEVGDWVNWFSTEQNQQFDKVYAEKMAGSSLRFTFK